MVTEFYKVDINISRLIRNSRLLWRNKIKFGPVASQLPIKFLLYCAISPKIVDN